MKRKYQVTFSLASSARIPCGFVVSRSIQTAETPEQAIEFAAMYHAVGKAKGRAVPVGELEEEEND